MYVFMRVRSCMYACMYTRMHVCIYACIFCINVLKPLDKSVNAVNRLNSDKQGGIYAMSSAISF